MTELQEYILYNRPMFGAFVFILGAIVGSFLNVVCLRLPKMMKREWSEACYEHLEITPENSDKEPFNLAFPASHCPSCNHAIQWWENIPVLSFLYLKGRCSNCSVKISFRYPMVEFVTAVMSFMVFYTFGPQPATLAGLLFTWMLIALAVIDYDEQLLPDNLTLPLLWIGLLVNFNGVFVTLHDAVIGAAAGYCSLWFVAWIFKTLTGKDGMGHGDFKLLAALGAWLGWQALPIIILLSSLVGAIIGISAIVALGRDREMKIPFGPYLASAGWACLLWREQIIVAYFDFLAVDLTLL